MLKLRYESRRSSSTSMLFTSKSNTYILYCLHSLCMVNTQNACNIGIQRLLGLHAIWN